MTGRKDDQGKLRYDLLPVQAEREIVEVLTFGAAKYGDENWRKVEGARSRYTAAARRHMAAWMAGERLDPESGLPHLAHCACCVIFLQELDRAAQEPAKRCNGFKCYVDSCIGCKFSSLGASEAPCSSCDLPNSNWEPS